MKTTTTKQRTKEVLSGWSKDSPIRAHRERTSTAPVGVQYSLYERAFKMALKGKKKSKVLNMGATPELRNLALNLGCQVIAVDINMDMIFNLEPHIKDGKNVNNVVMRGSWLLMDQFLKNKNFDIVAGDGVTGQLTPLDIKKVIKIIANLLKVGGHFISRVDVYLPDYPRIPYQKLLEQYRKKKIPLDIFLLEFLLYSDPYHKVLYDKKKKLMYTYKVFDILHKLYKKGEITAEENKLFQANRMSLTHYMLPKPELYGRLNKYFKEIPVKQITESWPTYVGKLKS